MMRHRRTLQKRGSSGAPMSFFSNFLFGRKPTHKDIPPSMQEGDGDSEKTFTNKMQEAVIVLIQQSWAQYENVYFKLPERYFNKVKNYLWLVTLIVGAKIKIAMDLYADAIKIPDGILKTIMFDGFAVSSFLEIIVFLVCIISLNAKHQIVMALEAPHSFLCSYNAHSYELLYNLLYQIEAGIKSCKERISRQNFYLGAIGWTLFIDLCVIMAMTFCCFKTLQGS